MKILEVCQDLPLDVPLRLSQVAAGFAEDDSAISFSLVEGVTINPCVC